MAPLVVIRSGSKYVEYRESRAEWMRQQQLKLHDAATGGSFSSGDGYAAASNTFADDEEERASRRGATAIEDEETDEETRFVHWRLRRHQYAKLDSDEQHLSSNHSAERRAACGFPLGLSTNLHAQNGMRGLNCADCGNLVADREDIVAKSFFGRTGKSFLMNNMFNIRTGTQRNRYLMTGMHTISDVCCSVCESVLGWKYIKAMETSQKYKEGKFILEKALVQDDWEEKAWQRR